MVVVKAYDNLSETFIPIDIPENIFNYTCLKEILEISDDPTESIVLPKDHVSYKSLLKIITDYREDFLLLVEEFRTRDFLALPTKEILEKIGTSEYFDPSLLGHCRDHVQKYLDYHNRFLFLRHFGAHCLSDMLFLWQEYQERTEDFPFGEECEKKIREFETFIESGVEYPDDFSVNWHSSEIKNFLLDTEKQRKNCLMIYGNKEFSQKLQQFVSEIPVVFSDLKEFPDELPDEISRSIRGDKGLIVIESEFFAPYLCATDKSERLTKQFLLRNN